MMALEVSCVDFKFSFDTQKLQSNLGLFNKILIIFICVRGVTLHRSLVLPKRALFTLRDYGKI